MEKNKILNFVSITPIVPNTFAIKKRFVISNENKDHIAAYFSGIFADLFLNYYGSTKSQIEGGTLHCHKLLKTLCDGPIIATLGGEEKVEITLGEIFFLMEKQKNGEDGILLNDGSGNIFYVRDKNGELRAVVVRWDDDDGVWFINAYSIEHPTGWSYGSHVFYKKLKKEV